MTVHFVANCAREEGIVSQQHFDFCFIHQSSEDPYAVPAGLHVAVLDGEHHEELEEESDCREEVPQVVVVEDAD